MLLHSSDQYSRLVPSICSCYDNWLSSGGKITTSISSADHDVSAAVASENCTYLDAYLARDLP